MEPISVAFRWEDKPGTPKKDTTTPPNPPSTSPFPLPPPPGARRPLRPPPPPPQTPKSYVVSIPFKWEEKPGTPLRSQDDYDDDNRWPPLQQAYSRFFECFDSDEESSNSPALLANRLMPASAISSAVPFHSSRRDEIMKSEEEGPSSSSPESTRISGSSDDSFLEQLFPLTTPMFKTCEPPESKPGERAIARTPTLGELIMMSRRRSCLQEVEVEVPTDDVGCCVFGAGNRGIEKLLTGKSFFMLKFA